MGHAGDAAHGARRAAAAARTPRRLKGIRRARAVTVLRRVAGFRRGQPRRLYSPLTTGAGAYAALERLAVTLEGLGIQNLFRVIVGGEDVENGKPHPDVFLMSAERLGSAPGKCLVFEDSPAGVEAARRGGMPCIVVNPMTPREAFGDTGHVLHFARDYYDLDIQTR